MLLKIGDKEQLCLWTACKVIPSALSCKSARLTFHSAIFDRYDLVLFSDQLTLDKSRGSKSNHERGSEPFVTQHDCFDLREWFALHGILSANVFSDVFPGIDHV